MKKYAKTYYPYKAMNAQCYDVAKIEAYIPDGSHPGIHIFGIDDDEAQELAHKITFILESNGYQKPINGVAVNIISDIWLSDDPNLQLPVTLAILGADYPDLAKNISQMMFMGEVGFDGEIRTNSKGSGFNGINEVANYIRAYADCTNISFPELVKQLSTQDTIDVKAGTVRTFESEA